MIGSYQSERESLGIFAVSGEVSFGIYKGLPISHVMNFPQRRIRLGVHADFQISQ